MVVGFPTGPRVFTLRQDDVSKAVGLTSWPSGVRLASYIAEVITRSARWDASGTRTVVELGAGSAPLASMTAALFGARVLVTDGLEEVLRLAHVNTMRNLGSLDQMTLMPLSWADEPAIREAADKLGVALSLSCAMGGASGATATVKGRQADPAVGAGGAASGPSSSPESSATPSVAPSPADAARASRPFVDYVFAADVIYAVRPCGSSCQLTNGSSGCPSAGCLGWDSQEPLIKRRESRPVAASKRREGWGWKRKCKCKCK